MHTPTTTKIINKICKKI